MIATMSRMHAGKHQVGDAAQGWFSSTKNASASGSIATIAEEITGLLA